MMKLEDFNNIDFKNAGNLPWPVKGVLLLALLLLLLAAGYWFVWSPAAEELEKARAKETELRKVFLDKKRQSINLDAYKEQMVEIERTFGALLKQLPDKSQMDGLLTDINQAGLARGLEFELFKPGKEVVGDFYADTDQGHWRLSRSGGIRSRRIQAFAHRYAERPGGVQAGKQGQVQGRQQ
jgi:type IV pilus assembly protein PilO